MTIKKEFVDVVYADEKTCDTVFASAYDAIDAFVRDDALHELYALLPEFHRGSYYKDFHSLWYLTDEMTAAEYGLISNEGNKRTFITFDIPGGMSDVVDINKIDQESTVEINGGIAYVTGVEYTPVAETVVTIERCDDKDEYRVTDFHPGYFPDIAHPEVQNGELTVQEAIKLGFTHARIRQLVVDCQRSTIDDLPNGVVGAVVTAVDNTGALDYIVENHEIVANNVRYILAEEVMHDIVYNFLDSYNELYDRFD